MAVNSDKSIQHYIDASIRKNTQKSYESAVRHYEVEWKGFLPATADNISQYLIDYADKLSINTLNQRLAALAQWHIEQGFPDPTKAPIVRKVLKGIKTLHPAQEKRAKPFQIEQLYKANEWLDEAISNAQETGNRIAELRHNRNKAFLLLGFWRGFRGDELTRLKIEFIEVSQGEGMICYLPQSKGDRHNKGTSFKVPALNKLCPVSAYIDWLQISELTDGAVFRSINQWGQLGKEGLHIDSLIPLLRKLFAEIGIDSPELYSSHSLRRGFANWATANGWDMKMLMEYVGWKNINSAMKYIESTNPFARLNLELKNNHQKE
ncbi:site-specific integrase [Acinetobacter junii]|uniref:site-specific integrase n=1 Tax=Acinetobacter junii TaxID=40215 RepID=UPI00124C69CC|nr:site-specific integrase [Acinetobacter junii]